MTRPDTTITLAELAAAVPDARASGEPTIRIAGLTADSREVRPDWLFLAYQGKERDLHDFVPAALARGAAAVAVERADAVPAGTPYLLVPDGRLAEGRLAAAFYGYPSRRLRVIGITGTDGKTTTSTLTHAVLGEAGLTAALLTTVSARIGDHDIDTGLHTTTPRAIDVQRLLAEMVDAGAAWVVLETTSHALAQHRTVGVEYDIAAFTNVTHEHLDEHGSFAAYRSAKGRLFEMLAARPPKGHQPTVAVLNADDPAATVFAATPADRTLRYSAGGAPAEVSARDIALRPDGSTFVAVTPAGVVTVDVHLPGGYNVANALAAISIGVALDLPLPQIAAGVARVRGIPGRMERIAAGQPFTVIVDFAHTPNSLTRALAQARVIAGAGRVIAMFGCAGERDREKRPLMGSAAARGADFTFITDEDRRREDVGAIMAEIAAGARSAGGIEGQTFQRVADRATAVRLAIGSAGPGDVVMLLGKGHERSMAFGVEERPWSDADAARGALAERGFAAR